MICRFSFRSNATLCVYSVGFPRSTPSICEANLQVFYKPEILFCTVCVVSFPVPLIYLGNCTTCTNGLTFNTRGMTLMIPTVALFVLAEVIFNDHYLLD